MSACARVLLVALALSVVPISGTAGGPGREPLWRLVSPVPGARTVDATMGDLDGDGLADLLLWSVGRDGPWWMVAVDGRGTVLWSRRTEGRPFARVVAGASGVPVVFTASGGALEILSGSGGDVIERRGLPGGAAGLAVGDMDGDGRIDVVVSSGIDRNDHLTGYSGVDLRMLFDTASSDDDSRLGCGFGRPLLADADGDGRCEAYVVENTDLVTKVASDGRRVWSTRLDERAGRLPKGAVTGGPVWSDVTGDGIPELVVGCLAGRLAGLDAESGDFVLSSRFGERSGEAARVERRLPRYMRDIVAGCGEPVNDPCTAELDGRPGLELVFGCSDGFLRAYSPASRVELWSIDCGGQVYDAPLAVDWDGDDRADVIAWHTDAALLVEGRSGDPLDGLPPIEHPGSLMLADLDGDGVDELIAVARGAHVVEAWDR